MIYMGSKNRISGKIRKIIEFERKENQPYVEPFVGGGNMIDKMYGIRIGSDINKYVIEGLISIRDFIDELPKNNKEFTEEDYKKLRYSDEYKHKGYASFSFSFGGIFLGGWARDSKGRDYVNRAYKNALIQSPKLQGVDLICCSYDQLNIPPNSIIYCDPPYMNTASYSNKFNHEPFWNWCRKMINEGHNLFISEYSAPDDFISVFETELNCSLNNKKATEKLFKHKSQIINQDW